MVVAESRAGGRTTDADALVHEETVRTGATSDPISDFLEAGSKLGRLTILDELGSGGMGRVYRARDEALARDVAVKVLKHARGRADPRATERLRREARALARLAHPNVIEIFDVDVDPLGRLYLSMELVEGMTLTQWLARAPRSRKQILDVLMQAGRGLAAAHEAGLVHRDFKLGNVLIDRAARVRVMDFGLARTEATPSESVGAGSPGTLLPSQEEEDLTAGGEVLGTPAYMAPEQLMRQRVDAATDQYAFCVALYRALAGKYPFSTSGRVSDFVAARHEPIDVRSLPRGLPRKVVAALRRGLSPYPSQRHASMGHLLASLESAGRFAWRVPAVLGATAAVSALVVLSLWNPEPEAQAGLECDPGAHRIGQTWSAEHRDALLQAADEGYDQRVRQRIAAILDGHAVQWATAYDSACTAERDGESASVGFDQAMGCLSHARGELAGVVDALAGADTAQLGTVVRAASELAPPRACLAAGRANTSAPVPREPDQATEVERVRIELARTRSRARAGDVEAAHASLQDLNGDVDSLAFVPLRVEWALQRAKVDALRGQLDTALRQAEDAFELAVEVGYERAAAEASIRLAQIYAAMVGDPHRAQTWASTAEAWIERVGAPPSLRAELEKVRMALAFVKDEPTEGLRHARNLIALYEEAEAPETDRMSAWHNLSVLLTRQGRAPEALEASRAALRVAGTSIGLEHHAVGQILTAMSSAAEAAGDPAQGEMLAREAIATLAAVHGPRHREVAVAMNNLGLALSSQGRLRESIETLRACLKIWQRIDVDEAVWTGPPRLNLAEALRASGQLEEARALLDESSTSFVAEVGAQHELSLHAETLLAHVEIDQGNVGAAMERLDEVVRQREHLSELHPLRVKILALRGLAALRLGDFPGSEAILQTALSMQDRQPLRASEEAVIRGALAEVLRQRGDTLAAREHRGRAEDLWRAAGRVPHTARAGPLP